MSSPTDTSEPIEGELVDTRPTPVPAVVPAEPCQPGIVPVQVVHHHYYLGSERIYRDADPEDAEAAFGYRPGEYLIDNTGSSTRTLVVFLFFAVLLLATAITVL